MFRVIHYIFSLYNSRMKAASTRIQIFLKPQFFHTNRPYVHTKRVNPLLIHSAGEDIEEIELYCPTTNKAKID